MPTKWTPPNPTTRTDELPDLPLSHTREQLREFRVLVAALPQRVRVPDLPKDPTPEQVEEHRRAVAVNLMQRMQAEAASMATDPKRIARDKYIADTQVRTLDQWIGRLQERRAILVAHLVLDDTP